MAEESPPRPDALRSLLDSQLQELVDVVRANGGQVPADLSANAERLALVLRLQRELAPPVRTRQRWIMGALFVATLALVTALLLATVPETEVELNLVVSELHFTLAAPQQLSELQQLATLGASGLARVALPGVQGAAGGTSRVLLRAAGGVAGGTITLAPLVAAKGAEVTLRTGDVPNELRMSVHGLDTTVQADLSGTIGVLLPRQGRQIITASTPQRVALTPGPGEVDLDLVPQNPALSLLAPSLAISTLALVRIDEVSQGGQHVARRVSTLHSGRVFFDELAGRELQLRPHEALRFEAARGEIRSVRVAEGRLIVDFHGRVRGMASGPSDHPRDLMPSWLDWLRANQPLALLWGAALYLFGLMTTLRQWWRTNS